MVLDSEAFALSRLWCLYEIGSTPLQKLQLLTHEAAAAQVVAAARQVDAATAMCFSDDDRRMITAHIEAKYGSLQQFTEQLRLRLLLQPLGYDADLAKLRTRCAGEVASLGPVKEALDAAGDGGADGSRAALVVGGAGEGKSTVASQAVTELEVAALHLCKKQDSRRQDPLLVARSLCYQLALRSPAARVAVLEGLLAEGGAAALESEEVATRLLVRALNAAPGSLLLVDGLDEAKEGFRNRVLELMLAVGKGAPTVRTLALMRPDPVAQRRLELAFAGGCRALSPAQLLPAGDGRQRVLRLVEGELRKRQPSKHTEGLALDAAYAAWLAAEPPDEATAQLLALVAAAFEPLTLSHVQELGGTELVDAVKRLPGHEVLFWVSDEFAILQLHASLTEWLRKPAAGLRLQWAHQQLAVCAANALAERRGGAGRRYAALYGHRHLSSVPGGEAEAAWARLLVCEDEGRPLPAQARGSPVRAAAGSGAWLLANATFGGVRGLAPELAKLETAAEGAAMRGWARESARLVGRALAPRFGIGREREAVDALADAAMQSVDGVWDGSAGVETLRRGVGGGEVHCQMTLPRSMGLSPELMELLGHSSYVRAVAFSPDGTRLASGSDDKTVKVWDASTGEAVQTLQGHSGDVSAVTFSPDGTRLASGSYDKTVKVWDWAGSCIDTAPATRA